MQNDSVGLTGGMSIREILAIAFREKRKIILAMLVPPAIAVALLLVLRPIYRAETGLVIKTGREYIAPEGQNSNLGPSSTLQEEVNTEIQIMTSRGVLQKAVDKIGVASIYPDLNGSLFGAGSAEDRAIDMVTKNLDVEPVKLSNVLSITFDHDDPKMATRVLSEIVGAYQSAHLEVYAGNRARAYQDGIQRDIDELDQLERDREKLKVENQVFDIALQRASLISQRSDAQAHLQDSQTRLVTLQKRLASLHASRNGIRTDVTSADTAKNELEYSQNALTDLHRAETALLARFSPDNPQVKQVREQIRELQLHIASLNGSVVGTKADPVTLSSQIDQQIVVDETEFAPLQAEITEYTGQIARISDELERIEKVDTDLRVLTGRIDAVNADLKMTREAYEQARTLDDMDRAKIVSVSQIQPVITPEKPAKPRKALFIGVGLLLGLLAGGGVIVVAVAANNTFMTAESVERLLRLPVLVTVPRGGAAKGGAGLVAG